MATVYLAEDLKHDRKVALKVLRPELAAVIGGPYRVFVHWFHVIIALLKFSGQQNECKINQT